MQPEGINAGLMVGELRCREFAGKSLIGMILGVGIKSGGNHGR